MPARALSPRPRPTRLLRWVAVLDAFANQPEWGVRDLAAATGLSPTATHRVLHDMADAGLLVAAPASAGRGRFRPGPELARLAIRLAERVDLRVAARPVLAAAARAIDETVILCAYAPARRAFCALEAAEPDHAIRYIWESLRAWSDLTRGASGKGILAFLPDAERAAAETGLPAAERDALEADLAAIRSAGVAISHGERVAGAVGAAAPIRDAGGVVVGSLLAGWPDNRTNPAKEAEIAAALVAAASEVTRALGGR